MKTYSDALEIIASVIRTLPAEVTGTTEALHRVTAQELSSPIAVPPFDNSAMDGFALRSADTLSASTAAPVRLPVVGTLTAGETATSAPAESGTAWEIMTGSPIPPGYDCVIPLEQVGIQARPDNKPEAVLISQPVEPARNLRHAGEDFQAGASLLDAGTCINAGQIMGLAAAGIQQLRVAARPRIATITTGNELEASAHLAPGMIHDANGPYLNAAIAAMSLNNAGTFCCGDSAADLAARIAALRDETDVILTTGGVSAGRMDFVPKTLLELDAEILFHKIGVRPGKPILFASIPDGPLVFGLPGNPVAVAVGFRFFVIPALRIMQGLPAESFATASLRQGMRKKPGMVFFAKAHVETDSSGQLLVQALPGQESFKINPLMKANCWIVADPEASEMAAGETVRIAPLLRGLKL